MSTQDRSASEAQPSAEKVPGAELSRRAREAVRLGQASFSRLLGLHHTTVWLWEHGQRAPNPRMRTVLRLVAAFPDQAATILREERGEPRRRRVSKRRLLKALRELGQGPLQVVPLDRLRANLADATPEKLDQLLITLEADGKIALRPPLFLGCLSAAEKSALLDHPALGKVLFVAIPGAY